MDRMYTPESVAWSCIRTRSPSSAPPENGDDGSTASTPTRRPSPRYARTSAAVDVDLPTPGLPVSPMTRACPAYGISATITSRSSGEAFYTNEISRPTARASPARARSTNAPTSGPATADLAALGLAAWGGTSGRHAQQQCVSLTATAAQCRSPQAAAAALELIRQRDREPGTGRADRMAERDGTTVDVDFFRVDAEQSRRVDGDRRERLVDLDEVEVSGSHARAAHRFLDRVRRLGLQRGVGAGYHAVVTDLGKNRRAELLCLGPRHHHNRGGAVGNLRRRPRRDR